MKWYEIILLIIAFVIGVYLSVKFKEFRIDFYSGRNKAGENKTKKAVENDSFFCFLAYCRRVEP
ncbi:hypothetical protein [Flavobacterium columnare]|uniref:hypothetical protein n=1 Tax=Flavobacterium columnare TaxID=996 RepID=UPI0013D0CE03|nr:hypothetical protein [Flavobacterium columnare]